MAPPTPRGETVAPAFAIFGALTLLSLIWFARLPADAGDEMNSRGRDQIRREGGAGALMGSREAKQPHPG